MQTYSELASITATLSQAGILTPANQTIINTHPKKEELDIILKAFLKCGILNQGHFERMIAHADLSDLSQAVLDLRDNRMCTRDFLLLVATHHSPFFLSETLGYLNGEGLLNPANQAILLAHTNLQELSPCMYVLLDKNMLNQDNFARLIEQPDIEVFSNVLNFLFEARIISQMNFDSLILPNHATLISQQALEHVWNRIPPGLLTQANFQRLLIAAEHPNPMQALIQATNQIIGLVGVNAFNPRQSTHTASVHRSVTESVKRLALRYGADLRANFRIKIKEMVDYLNLFDPGLKNSAVKRGFMRMLQNNEQINYLVLAWVAIHDETHCYASREEALALFIDGIYEIQRGYNIDELGIDNGLPDSPICHGGTLNKIMEKLNGIHPDVEVYYITQAAASAKFPKLAQAHALSYLQTLANPQTKEEYLNVSHLFTEIEHDASLAPIWDKIKLTVIAELFEEFKQAYADNPSHAKFLDLVNYGYAIAAPRFASLKTQMQTSNGYQAYLQAQVAASLEEQGLIRRLAQNSFWSHRHTSAEAQHTFDQQYGLVIRP